MSETASEVRDNSSIGAGALDIGFNQVLQRSERLSLLKEVASFLFYVVRERSLLQQLLYDSSCALPARMRRAPSHTFSEYEYLLANVIKPVANIPKPIFDFVRTGLLDIDRSKEDTDRSTKER